MNAETEVLHRLAQSFYTFFRTGVFRSEQIDISQLTLEQAYECQHYFHKLRIADGDRPIGYKVGCTSAAIREQFGVDEANSQSLLSGYFISLAFFQLFYGVLSDRYGRRRPLFVGLAILALGGLTAAFAESFEILILARILQGFGAASVYSIIRAIISDSYGRLEGASTLALITGIMLIVPICSFAFGGLITDLVSWRGVMLGIFLAGLVPLVLNLSLIHI